MSGLLAVALAALAAASSPTPAIPGGCVALASDNEGKPGCYLAAEFDIPTPPPQVYWLIFAFPSRADADAAAKTYRWSRVVEAHQRIWLLALSETAVEPGVEGLKAQAGPVAVPGHAPVNIRLLESWFPPGMKTRVHAHPGAEIFYVVDGEQCVETPQARARIKPGETFIVDAGPHVQAAPTGRRSLVMLVVPEGKPWMQLREDWQPDGYCNSVADDG